MPLDLAKIIDFNSLRRLLDTFHAAMGISVSIIALDGETCSSSAWQTICSDFYLRRPESGSACLNNETRLKAKLMRSGSPVVECCPYGLFNAATPIFVDRNHVANLFTGKFFFEPPDPTSLATFKQQAAKWDFDEKALIAAVQNIPVISREKIFAILQYLRLLAEMVGEMGFTRLKLEEKTEHRLQASEARFRQVFDLANDGICVLKDGMVIDCNPRALALFNASREEMIGQAAIDFSLEIQPGGWSSRDEILKNRERVGQGMRQFFDWQFKRQDGSFFTAEVSLTRHVIDGAPHTLVIIRDITERKKMIHALQKREHELEEKSRYLEKVNQALKASLDHREVEIRAVEENMLVNLKRFVFPYIEELGNCKINTDARAYLNIIETNLNDIVSRFSKSVFWKYLDLTPTEVRIADLIRSGKNSKAIAQMLGLSPSSVQWHRKNIREKLGLTNKKVNLRTYLSSLSE